MKSSNMTLSEVCEKVFEHKPELKKVYENFKDVSWIEYAKAQYPKNKKLFINTADHQGILHHPFFSQNALLQGILGQDRCTQTLGCGGISMNNSSYPRGIAFHDQYLNLVKIPFKTLFHKHAPVLALDPLKGEYVMRNLIHHLENPKVFLKPSASKRLISFFEEAVGNEEFAKQETFAQQCDVINRLLMEKIFPENSYDENSFRGLEEFVTQELLENHITQKTAIHHILFDKKTTQKYLTHFQHIIGGFTFLGNPTDETKFPEMKGTHLFWHIIPKTLEREQLFIFIKDGALHLTNRSKSFETQLDPYNISRHLSEKDIFPSLGLCYVLLAFYNKCTLGGGFSQIQYLTDLKNAYVKTIEDVISKEELSAIQKIQTNIFTGEQITIGLTNGAKTVEATTFDMLLYAKNASTHEVILRQFQKDTVGKSLNRMMHEYYKIIFGMYPRLKDPEPIPETFRM